MLVLTFSDDVHSTTQASDADADTSFCSKGVPLRSVMDSLIKQQMGIQKAISSKHLNDRVIPNIMRLLRLMGVEVLWERDFQSTQNDNAGGDDNTCTKDIDGCYCEHKTQDTRITLDHLLSERNGFYNVVLNLDVTNSRSSMLRGHVCKKSSVEHDGGLQTKKKLTGVCLISPETAL